MRRSGRTLARPADPTRVRFVLDHTDKPGPTPPTNLGASGSSAPTSTDLPDHPAAEFASWGSPVRARHAPSHDATAWNARLWRLLDQSDPRCRPEARVPSNPGRRDLATRFVGVPRALGDVPRSVSPRASLATAPRRDEATEKRLCGAAHCQPRTWAACSIHFPITGACASLRAVSFT